MESTTVFNLEEEFKKELNESLDEEHFERLNTVEEKIYLELMFIFSILGGLFAVIIITVIIISKQLQSQYTYKYILHWCCLTVVYTISLPLFLRFLPGNIPYTFICIGVEIHLIAMILNFILTLLMTVDSLLSIHYPSTSLKFRRRTNTIFAIFYITGLFILALAVTICIKKFTVSQFLAPLTYGICLLTYISLMIFHACKKRKRELLQLKPNLIFILAGVYMLCWFLKVLFALFAGIVDAAAIQTRIAIYLLLVALLNPAFNLIVLCVVDGQFAGAFIQLCKFKFRRDGDESCINCEDAVEYDVKEEAVGSKSGTLFVA